MNRYVIACALSATACGGAKTRDVLLSSEVRLEGRFTPRVAGAPLTAYTLDANGVRVPAASFAFDQATNHFTAQVDATQVQTNFVVTPLDRVLSPNLAVAGDYAIGRLDEASAGIVSVEIGPPPGALVVTGPLGGYAKFELLVKRSSAFTERVGAVLPIALGSNPSAAAARARVTTYDGVPIAGARVFSVESVVAANGASAINDPFAPGSNRLVATTTDAFGEAVVFPVPIDATTRAFQLVADAPGYCTQTTNLQQMKSSIDPNFVYVLKLAVCDRSTRLQAPDILVEISPKNNTRDDLGQTVALVRAGIPLVVNLRLRNTVVGPIVANVYAGIAAIGAPLSSVVYGSVEDEAAVKLPEVDGEYFVTFAPLSNPENAPVRGVRVSRGSVVPVALAGDFTATGPGGTPDVLSGFAGKNFVVSYAGCTGAESISFFFDKQITEPTLPFVPCDPAGNSFDPAEFGLDEATGPQVMAFFVRDIFGNASAVDAGGANEREVFVDVSPPLLSETAPSYTVDFGFAPAVDAPGTNASPYVFQRSAAALVRITPATISNFVLRFARPSACVSAPEPGAGVADARDVAIGFFQIVRSGVSSFAICGNDLPLAAGDLRFPEDATASANFLLTVKDLVGNTAEPSVYELPSCANPAASAACWEP